MKIPKEYVERCKESNWDFDYASNKIDRSRFNVFARIKRDISYNSIAPSSNKITKTENTPAVNQIIANGQRAGDRFELFLCNETWGNEFVELANLIPWKTYSVHIHRQLPGHMHPFHMDFPTVKGMNHEDKLQKVRRCWIMLDDWYPGQVVQMGNHVWTKWKKGDVVYFDWQNLPHGTSNFGHHPRPIISTVGFTTPAFEEAIKSIRPIIL